MSERNAIETTAVPATVESLTAQLRELGVEPADVLVVHASLSALGFVVGGAQAVVQALMAAVGPDGTVSMPSHSSDWSEPSYWQAPPVPAAWWPVIRDHLPAFDPHATPLREMGAVAGALHRLPGTVRSSHPCLSHMANGPDAARITADHSLAHGLGEGSPLARLYDLDAKVVLLGVGHANNTSLHLAEHRADWPGRQVVVQGSPVLVDGERRWVTYEDLDGDTEDFGAVGAAFAAGGGERTGTVGAGTGRCMRQRALVDFATVWFTDHRSAR